MLPLVIPQIFIGYTEQTLDTWEVKIKGVVYRVKASTNAEARWEGARRYYLAHGTNMTISMLYQLAQCYLLYGRKATPW